VRRLLTHEGGAACDGGDAFFFDELILAALEGKDKFKSTDTQTGNYDQSWLSERVFDNRTSLIIDPPDGRIPPTVPGYAERARAARVAASAGRGPADRDLIEKFKRVADDTLEYYVTIEDPTVWTRPWTLMIPLKRTGEEMFEYACHEGNYGLPAILRGARVQEAEAAAKRP
jgi:hypothetical protein